MVGFLKEAQHGNGSKTVHSVIGILGVTVGNVTVQTNGPNHSSLFNSRHGSALFRVLGRNFVEMNFFLLRFIHFIHQWLYSPLFGPSLSFSFVIFSTQAVGLLGRVKTPSQGLYLHAGQHKRNKRTQTSMPLVGLCYDTVYMYPSKCLSQYVRPYELPNSSTFLFQKITVPQLVYWTHMPEERNQWSGFVNTSMKVRVL
jgi:hypothetical protein